MAGSIFRDVAEKVMALKSNREPTNFERDTISKNPTKPFTKVGYYNALQTVMSELQLPLGAKTSNWVKTFSDDRHTRVERIAVSRKIIPNVVGMGAKDAVYLLERMGLNVQVLGRGKVVSQNRQPGTVARKGSTIIINFQ